RLGLRAHSTPFPVTGPLDRIVREQRWWTWHSPRGGGGVARPTRDGRAPRRGGEAGGAPRCRSVAGATPSVSGQFRGWPSVISTKYERDVYVTAHPGLL